MLYSWIDRPGYEKHLKGDIKLISDLFGMQGVVKVLENLAGSTIYISTNSIKVLHPVYIAENPDLTVKQLSRIFGTSEMYVYGLKKNLSINHLIK